MKKRIPQPRRKGRRLSSVMCIAALASFALFAACNRPEPEPGPVALITLDDGPIPFSEIQLPHMVCGWRNDSILLLHDNRVILINDTQDYHYYVDCDCGYYPDIDFDRNSVVVWSGIGSAAVIDPYGYFCTDYDSADFECVNGVVHIHLYFVPSLTLGNPPPYVKAFLLPKISSNTTFSIDRHVLYSE